MSRRPEPALVAAACVTVLLELATRSNARYAVEAAVTAGALAYVWRQRAQLRPAWTVAVAAALPVAILLAHLTRGVDGDTDVQVVYPSEGQSLLDGTYPHAEYPPLGVFLFALERATGSLHAANGIAMALCHAVVVAAVLALRTREAPFVAAALAVWPLDAFFWEFKYDLLPTALLAVGLAAAYRGRWGWAGLALSAGALAKWTPAIAFVLLALWLACSGRRETVTHFAAAFVAPMVVVLVPLALWDADALGAAWSRQAGRHITPEALWYLVLAPLGLASRPGAVYDAADAPGWTNWLAGAVQLAALAVLAWLVARRPPPAPAAIALAALGPAVFLVLNRIFSAQFVVTIGAATAVAAALVAAGRRLVATLALLGLASGFNLLVYPITKAWEPASALLFLSLGAAVLAVLVAARRYKPLTNGGYPLRS